MLEPSLSKLNVLVNQNPVFWFCALAGSGMFFIQFLLSLFIGDSHHHADDSGIEIDSGKFKWLSKQAVTGFLMMFGWAGLTCIQEFELSRPLSIVISLVSGVVTIFMLGIIFRSAKKLRSSGNVFKIEDLIGKEAVIYHRIPKNGIGKISISLNNLTYEIEAISLSNEDLPSFTKVQVIKKSDNKTAVVIPI